MTKLVVLPAPETAKKNCKQGTCASSNTQVLQAMHTSCFYDGNCATIQSAFHCCQIEADLQACWQRCRVKAALQGLSCVHLVRNLHAQADSLCHALQIACKVPYPHFLRASFSTLLVALMYCLEHA